MKIFNNKLQTFLLFIGVAGLWMSLSPAVASPLGADSFFTVDIPEGWTIEAKAP